jgi:hypothetical protein
VVTEYAAQQQVIVRLMGTGRQCGSAQKEKLPEDMYNLRRWSWNPGGHGLRCPAEHLGTHLCWLQRKNDKILHVGSFPCVTRNVLA